jgi:hypothetical protein
MKGIFIVHSIRLVIAGFLNRNKNFMKIPGPIGTGTLSSEHPTPLMQF